MNKILVSVVLALALVGAVDARTSSYSSGSRSYSSSSSSSSSSSRGSYSSPSRSYSSPSAAPKAAPTYKSPTYTPRPSVTNSSTPRPSYGGSTTIVHEHHYFGGGYGSGPGYYGGYSGGFGNSPFFWLWLFSNNNHQQPVYVQGNAVPSSTGGATSSYSIPVEGPSGWTIFFNVLLGVLMIGAIVALIVWIVKKVISSRQ